MLLLLEPEFLDEIYHVKMGEHQLTTCKEKVIIMLLNILKIKTWSVATHKSKCQCFSLHFIKYLY